MEIKENRPGGFTVLELLIVLGVITILSAVAVPSLSKKLPELQISGAARDVLAVLQQARLRAAKEQDNVVVAFTTGAGSGYTAFVDADGDQTQDAGEKVITRGRLPDTIRITSAVFSPASVAFTSFNKSGFPDIDFTNYSGTVTLTNNAGSVRRVELNAAGNSRIEK